MRRLTKLEGLGHSVTIFPDAEEFIQQQLHRQRVEKLVREIRAAPDMHPLRCELLKHELLPYQLDGIAFAAGAGRAIVADEMGLGKTIQAIGPAELLAREAGISRVLVICPTSVKNQWRSEIIRFSDRSVQVVLGKLDERPAQYASDTFFTVCNYVEEPTGGVAGCVAGSCVGQNRTRTGRERGTCDTAKGASVRSGRPDVDGRVSIPGRADATRAGIPANPRHRRRIESPFRRVPGSKRRRPAKADDQIAGSIGIGLFEESLARLLSHTRTVFQLHLRIRPTI